MSIYILTLITCLVFSMFYYQKSITNYSRVIKTPNYKIIYIILAFFFLAVLGLRSSSVGIDTINYQNIYMSRLNENFSYLLKYNWYDGVGHSLIIFLFRKLGLPWQMYVLFMAAIYIVPIMYVAYIKTNNPFFALTIFILSGSWTYSMSTMRQAAAMGIVIIAFLYINRPIKCFLYLLLAATFHVSALISFLLYFVSKIPLNKKNVYVWLGSGIGITVFALGPLQHVFFQLMNMFGRTMYVYDEATGGWLQEMFFVLTVLIGMFYSFNYENEDYVFGLKAIFLSAVLLPVVRINPTLFRVYSYFSIYQIIFVPLLLNNINDRVVKVLGYVGYVSVYMYIFFTLYMIPSIRVIPYRFFWQ